MLAEGPAIDRNTVVTIESSSCACSSRSMDHDDHEFRKNFTSSFSRPFLVEGKHFAFEIRGINYWKQFEERFERAWQSSTFNPQLRVTNVGRVGTSTR